MTVYAREDADAFAVVDRWAGGVGWLAHPNEAGERVSHAVKRIDAAGEPSVWVVDPLDAPDLDDLLAEYGEVAGVVVCSNYHARDAGTVARRHGVPVHLPAWGSMDRVVDRLGDVPVERFREGVAGFDARRVDPVPGWTDTVLYRDADETLYVPDVLSPTAKFAVDDERIGAFLLSRLSPPRAAFGGVDPDRILFGHGTGVHEGAAEALADCLANARRLFPRAVVQTAPAQFRAVLGAFWD